jgi:hypothetical protein
MGVYRRGPSLSQLAKAVERTRRLLADVTKARIAIGLAERSRRCFDTKRTPEGVPWAPAADGHPDVLVRTRQMMNGVRGEVRRNSITINSTDWKSKFHLVPYYRKIPPAQGQGRDKKGRFQLKQKPRTGRLIRPARRWLPIAGTIPNEWMGFMLGVVRGQFYLVIRIQ